MTAFWYITTHIVEVDRRFRGAYWINHLVDERLLKPGPLEYEARVLNHSTTTFGYCHLCSVIPLFLNLPF
jgi:hypothetical protein